METIIGLLFILLPVILKLVGKKLEQSNQPEKAKKLQDFIDTIYEGSDKEDNMEVRTDNALEVEYDDDGQIISVHPKMGWKPMQAPSVRETKVSDPQIHMWDVKEGVSSVKKKPILVEEAPKKKREKIDPKKLVIYSEIMKPKF
ncbi:MAG: hypothetical protein IKU36_03765 [Bacteroidales bacterium]|nr:hypothetical protein [Bacteroidales bacterium]